jgi:hypothetical protein
VRATRQRFFTKTENALTSRFSAEHANHFDGSRKFTKSFSPSEIPPTKVQRACAVDLDQAVRVTSSIRFWTQDRRRKIMLRSVLIAGLATLVPALTIPSVAETAALSEQEAHAIGVDAYLYFYPLITMDLTRKQSTNIAPGKEIAKGPMNMFVSVPEYPPADVKLVVRPNFDTLYSPAWLDLTKEPMVISAPNTDGR